MEEDVGIELVVRRERKGGKHGMGLMGTKMGMTGALTVSDFWAIVPGNLPTASKPNCH